MKGGQLRACIIFGRGQLKHREGESRSGCTSFAPEKNHPWRKSGTRDAANDIPGAKQHYLAESITRMGQFDTRCKRWAQASGGKVLVARTSRVTRH